MQPHSEMRARVMVSTLEPNCGLILNSGAVIACCAVPSYRETPTLFDETDLNNAIELKLLEKRKVTISRASGTSECEWYAVPPRRASP